MAEPLADGQGTLRFHRTPVENHSNTQSQSQQNVVNIWIMFELHHQRHCNANVTCSAKSRRWQITKHTELWTQATNVLNKYIQLVSQATIGHHQKKDIHVITTAKWQ